MSSVRPRTFENDPFYLIAKAFKNLYPNKRYTAYWEPNIRDGEGGTEVYGLTDFGDDGKVTVFVKPSLSVSDAAEIFAHELSHVAVGVEHEHDDEWNEAFSSIFDEYNRIGDEMFSEREEAEL